MPKQGKFIIKYFMSLARFSSLPASPFARLRHLLADIKSNENEISLAIGEPRHAPPAFVLDELDAHKHDYAKYPPIAGIDRLRHAISGWLKRRFNIDETFIPPDTHILPVNGTREGLFLAAQLAPPKPDPCVIIPNPFYQAYATAALAAGAQPVYAPASAAHGFLPDLDALAPALLTRCTAFYLCSPANPQGAVANTTYLQKLLTLSETYNFLVIMDECYTDIYDRALEKSPPPSLLQIMQQTDRQNAHALVFQSLSKRSNLPGLRSGFCAGGTDIMQEFSHIRHIVAPQTPLPTQYAASRAWADDAHVAENRRLYQEKIDIAETHLKGAFDFYRPQGGFFLWLRVDNDEMATVKLWRETGIRVLPGSYLGRGSTGENPGETYIRVALVGDIKETEYALKQLRACLE